MRATERERRRAIDRPGACARVPPPPPPLCTRARGRYIDLAGPGEAGAEAAAATAVAADDAAAAAAVAASFEGVLKGFCASSAESGERGGRIRYQS